MIEIVKEVWAHVEIILYNLGSEQESVRRLNAPSSVVRVLQTLVSVERLFKIRRWNRISETPWYTSTWWNFRNIISSANL